MNDPKNHRTEPAWQASPELRAKVEEYEDRETPIIPRIPIMPEPATAIYCCESRSVNAVKWEHNHPLVSGMTYIQTIPLQVEARTQQVPQRPSIRDYKNLKMSFKTRVKIWVKRLGR